VKLQDVIRKRRNRIFKIMRKKIFRLILSWSIFVCILLILWLLSFNRQTSSISQTPPAGQLRLPLSTQVAPSSHILQESWIHGTSQDGFLQVEEILHDPRTTKDPAHVMNMIVSTPTTSDLTNEKNDKHERNKKKMTQKLIEHQLKVKNDILFQKNEKNEDFQSVMNYNSHFKPHITKDIYTDGFTVNRTVASDKCQKEEILLTILVISSPNHFQQREAIRKSWGISNKEVVLSFLVGVSKDDETQRQVLKESEENEDIIVNNIIDTYENLSLKTLSAFNWFLHFCNKSEFLLKVDDDMFVQVEKVLDKVRETIKQSQKKKLIMGNISRNWKPVRNPQSKYFITEAQYSEERYPDFATGPSYLVSKAALRDIYQHAMELNYIHLEDVFLTGVVAEDVNVSREDLHEFKNNAVRIPAQFMGCTIEKSFTIHKVGPSEQLELHQLSKDPNCGRPNKKNLALQTKKLIKAFPPTP